MSANRKLLEAAESLLVNAIDTGECLVDFLDPENDDREYPTNEDGDRWYHDWWELREAVDTCNRDDMRTGPAADTAPELKQSVADLLVAIGELTTHYCANEAELEEELPEVLQAVGRADLLLQRLK